MIEMDSQAVDAVRALHYALERQNINMGFYRAESGNYEQPVDRARVDPPDFLPRKG